MLMAGHVLTIKNFRLGVYENSKKILAFGTFDLCKWQKQPPRDVPKKRCSENMEQIYRRTPMPKCDFDKVSKQLY